MPLARQVLLHVDRNYRSWIVWLKSPAPISVNLPRDAKAAAISLRLVIGMLLISTGLTHERSSEQASIASSPGSTGRMSALWRLEGSSAGSRRQPSKRSNSFATTS